ncbi:MAG TPA: glycerate kinase [Verrucomicrobiae bacterium]|nr:glycerate kinase [Verrucomicrobiae bacterium]
MSLRVLIVPDKFKATLTAREAAQAIARGWRDARPEDELDLLPMSDGGDGFGEVMSRVLGAQARSLSTRDAAHRPCAARWWWNSQTHTALLDTARVVGLAMLPPGRYHPFELDTYGLGELVRAVVRAGAKRCVVGLGGSATNDAGFGLARALGWKFEERSGRPIERWTDLWKLASLRPPAVPSQVPELVVAVDVQNRLLGPRGATRVYGPQKGLKTADFAAAERALKRLASAMKEHRHFDFAAVPGSGAAGGLGFGFAAFLGGRLAGGFDLFAREVGLESKLARADLVITGEGRIDVSSTMGKGAGCVAKLCSRFRLPCLGFAGTVEANSKKLFTRTRALTDLTTNEEAMRRPRLWLRRLARQTAAEWMGATHPEGQPKSTTEPITSLGHRTG